jgi:hypothetical protein
VLVRLGGILLLAMLAIWLYCLLDAATADKRRVRGLPKTAWVAVVVVTFVVGAIAWLTLGRPRGPERAPRLGASRRTSWPSRPDRFATDGTFRRPGPVAPDDDAEFLARLDREATRDHEKLLGSWEADLRRREEELRRKDGDDDAGEGTDRRD